MHAAFSRDFWTKEDKQVQSGAALPLLVEHSNAGETQKPSRIKSYSFAWLLVSNEDCCAQWSLADLLWSLPKGTSQM